MNLSRLSPEIHRREFLLRSSLLSAAGLTAQTNIYCAEPSGPNPSARPATTNAIVEIFTKGLPLDTRPLPLDRFAPADGEVVWAARNSSGQIVPKVAPAKGVVYRPTTKSPLLRVEETDKRTLKQKVMADLADKTYDPCVTFFADNVYYLPTLDDLKLIVADSYITNIVGIDGIPNQFDCDDFAFAMKGAVSLVKYRDRKNPLGEVAFCFGVLMGDFGWIGAAHVACFFVEANSKSVRLLDPRHQVSDLVLQDVRQGSNISMILI